MSDQEYIRSLVREAELYKTQGLLVDSKKKYLKALRFIETNDKLCNHRKLINAIGKKIETVEEDLVSTAEETGQPELSDEVQELIKRLFSFSRNKDAAAVEGVVALAKFGQYERALMEFHRLLKEGILPVTAAKNIIRCHLALCAPQAAVEQFRQWVSDNTLSKNHLNEIRALLDNVLKKKGIKAELPVVVEGTSDICKTQETAGEVLDVSSVKIKLENGPRKGETIELDVTFQSGNIISIVISDNQKELIESLKIGIRLPNMQFYSPIAIFRGSGTVSGKSKIKSGPKQGSYMLDIRVDSR